ncbi:MAG: DUF2721 domain-containing protein [bacterium]
MELTFATPALLFPAVSLLFLSYTNRFLSYANLVRGLHEQWRTSGEGLESGGAREPVPETLAAQISNLRRRIFLIRNMQIFGAVSLLLCILSMIVLVFNQTLIAELCFAAALVAMLISLALLVIEVSISVRALEIQLGDLESVKSHR